MKTFKEYQVTKEESNYCDFAEEYTWDGEPLIEGSPEWLEAIKDENIQEVQKGSVSFLGLGFSALTGYLPIYLAYKMVVKSMEKAKAGCSDLDTIIARSKCLADFRRKKIEAKIKLLSKVKSKEKDPGKIKKIDKQIGQQKKAIGKIRVNF